MMLFGSLLENVIETIPRGSVEKSAMIPIRIKAVEDSTHSDESERVLDIRICKKCRDL